MTVALAVIAVVAVFILIILAAAIRILREYERGVIFRLGRLIAQKGPGLILLIPFIDQMVRIDLRTITLNVPPQEVITKDNVTVRVNAVAYFRVIDPNKAVTEVENFLLATSQIAQTTLRSVLGKAELDALLSERERLNLELQQIIDEQTEPWGVKVSTVEVKDVELPADMQRAIVAPGRGRARAAGEDHRRRRRVPGRREALAGGEHHQREPGDAAAALPADAGRDRRQQQLDDRLPAAARPAQAAARAARAAERAAAASRRRLRAADPELLSSPEIRIDQLTGLRAILAPGRAERPDAFDPRPPEPRPDARRALPVLRGPRGPHAARGLGGPARRRRRRTRPGWTAALGAQPLPGAREAAGEAARPSGPATESGIRARSTRSAPRPAAPGRPVPLPAGDRRPRGDRQRPRARDLARRALATSGSPARSPPGASACAPTPTPPTCT